jgi:hypothetical protein
LRRRGEITNYLLPISLILATQPKGYVDGLTEYRQGAVSEWVEQFAHATTRACAAAERLANAIAQLQADWLDALGQPRRDAAVRRLVSILPEQPVIDVAVAQRLTGKSHVAIGKALQQLEDAGVIDRLNQRKWDRAWECDALLSLVDSFEKSVQSSGMAQRPSVRPAATTIKVEWTSTASPSSECETSRVEPLVSVMIRVRSPLNRSTESSKARPELPQAVRSTDSTGAPIFTASISASSREARTTSIRSSARTGSTP